jgi:hypothetical protein
MRVVLVDLLCNSPFYCGELTQALCRAGVDAQLASPRFYLEPQYLEGVPRPSWVRDLVVRASRPRALRLAVRAIEGSLNFVALLAHIRARDVAVVHVQWVPVEGRSSPFMPILRRWCDSAGTLLVYTAHNAVPHDEAAVDRAALRRDLDRAHLVIAPDRAHRPTAQDGHRDRDAGRRHPHARCLRTPPAPRGSRGTAETLRAGRPVPGPRPARGARPACRGVADGSRGIPTATLLVVGKVADLDRVGTWIGSGSWPRHGGRPLCDGATDARLTRSRPVVFPYRRISQSAP